MVRTSTAERRNKLRFPVALDLRYVSETDGCGVGRTIDLSSSAISFDASHPLRRGQWLQIQIDWPANLEGGISIQLVIKGKVIRARGTFTVLQINAHQFHTRRAAAGAAGA